MTPTTPDSSSSSSASSDCEQYFIRAKKRRRCSKRKSSPSNFEEDEVDKPKRGSKDGDQKKRRPSVFSKFGSYRQRKLAKDTKSKTTHQFVSVSFSNSTACDVCSKFMANKAALQCENCMVNVHENSCKDQIAQCRGFKNPKLQYRDSGKMARYQSSSLPGENASVKTTNSMKHERQRATSVPARPQQLSHPAVTMPRHTSLGKVINEEREKDGKKEDATDGKTDQQQIQQQLQQQQQLSQQQTEVSSQSNQLQIGDGTNMTDTMSVSMESLDEGAAEIDFDDDPDLLCLPEAEAWSVTVDKKTLKKMSAKDIKRQDHIWELIQTEKHYCRTLKIMQKIFSRGMAVEVHMSHDMIDRIFPRLGELIDVHVTFLHSLTDRQRCRPDRSIEDIGDLLIQQFEGEMGERMKLAYGEFCSRHNEAVQLYKDLHKNDRKFQNFIKKCSRNSHTKRLGIPECILYVTQRMTKYPLLVEPIIKTTKDTSRALFADSRPEHVRLKRALELTRGILSYIDAQVDARAKEQRLIEIYNKLDARSYAIYKGTKFKKSDLLSNNRKLLSEGTIRWMSARGKAFEALAVILSDVMFFLQENNQKYTFFSQDNKSSVVSLSKLLVREKGDTKDSKGIYLICQSKTEPEMYELVCRSADERKAWINTIRGTIAKCPEEDEGLPSESEEERKLQAARSAKLRTLIEQLHDKDALIKLSCDEKLKTMVDMRDLFLKEDFGENGTELHTGNSAFYTPKDESANNLKSVYKDEDGQELMDPEELLQAALKEASRLYITLQSGGTSLSRSVSSVGEHESASYTTPPLPKRAETFSGFEAREKDKNLAATKRAETFAGFEAKERDHFKPVKKRYSSGSGKDDGSTGSLNDGHVIVMPSQQRDVTDLENLLTTETTTTGKSLSSRRGSCGTPAAHEAARQSNKERGSMSRRMSTSFLQSLLIKQHNEKDDADSQKSGGSSDRGSVGSSIGDLLTCTAPSSSQLQLLQPNKEQTQTLLQLVYYMQTLVTITLQQSTEVESFRMQYVQANKDVSRLQNDAERLAHERKNVYHHDKQLEGLRNLQESINQEKAQWEKVKEKERANLKGQQDDFEVKEKELQQQRDEIRALREKIQREREALQCQMDLFEQLKVQTAREQLQQEAAYSPNTSSADSPSTSQRPLTSRTPDSPSIRPVPPSSVPQLLWDNVAHKRSSSEDLQRPRDQGEAYEPMKEGYSNSLKEPLSSNRDSRETHREMRRDSRSRSDSRTRLHPSPQGSSVSSSSCSVSSSGHRDSMSAGKQRDVSLPIHLVSATNEQKVGHVPQQLPLKLVALGSSKSSSSLLQSSSSNASKFSYKLSGDSTPGAVPQSGGGAIGTGATSPAAGVPHHHPHHPHHPQHQPHHHQAQAGHHQPLQQTPVTYTTTGSSMVPLPPTKHVTMPPNMNIVNPGGIVHHGDTSSATSSRIMPTSGVRSPASGQVTHSILPMKLASSNKSRQKSMSPSSSGAGGHPVSRTASSVTSQPAAAGGSAATQQSSETPKSSKHSQRSSQKEHIIYF